MDAGRRFANKIWNASRLVLGTRDGRTGPPSLPAADAMTLPERWLLSRHETMLEEVDSALGSFHFAEATDRREHTFGGDVLKLAVGRAPRSKLAKDARSKLRGLGLD